MCVIRWNIKEWFILEETLKPKIYTQKMQLLLATVREKNGFLTFWYAVFKRHSIVWPRAAITKWNKSLFFKGKKTYFVIKFLGKITMFLYGYLFLFFWKCKKENKYETKGNWGLPQSNVIKSILFWKLSLVFGKRNKFPRYIFITKSKNLKKPH